MTQITPVNWLENAKPPAPMSIFKDVVIHPENQELVERRLAYFRPMPHGERRRAERRVRWLLKALNAAGFNRLVDHRADVDADYQRAFWDCVAIAGQQQAFRVGLLPTQVDPGIRARAVRQFRSLQRERRALRAQLDKLMPLYNEYVELASRLKAHDEIVQRIAEKRRAEKELRKESLNLWKLIQAEFAFNKRCHHIWHDKRGRRHTDIPKIEDIWTDTVCIHFKIAASQRGLFGGWRRLLPYDVDIAGLVDQKTLDNMSIVCGRQVQASYNDTKTAVYYRVNRLDMPDGLPKFVTFKQMFDLYPADQHDRIPFPGGVVKNGKVLWLYLDEDPHLLIGGQTRGGKSNFINCLIATLCQMHTPRELRLVLIDNKGGVEFTHWHDLPHVLGSIVKHEDKVLPALKMVIRIMRHRFDLLEKTKAKKITAYNRQVAPEQRLERIVVFVDELSALTGLEDTGKIHKAMELITAQGAAAGVHMVLCTQYPERNTVPSKIKANCTARIATRMPSGAASMTILTNHEATRLPKIKGRVVLENGPDQQQMQTPYISDDDISHAVRVALSYKPEDAPASALIGANIGTEPELTVEIEPEHSDAAAIEIPPEPELIPVKPPFTVDDLLAVAIDQLGGNLGAKPIFDVVKLNNLASRNQIEKMVKSLIAKGSAEYCGVEYAIFRNGKGYYLRKKDQTPETPVASA